MFIGHYAPALIAAAVPRAPRLWVLFVAAQLVDFAFFGFVLLGVEHMRVVPYFTATNSFDLYDMRWTHSLVGTLGWAGVFALVLRLLRQSWRAAMIAAGVVASHWLLDLIVHAPDLTLAGAPPRFGLALWNYPAIAMPLELAITFTAIAFYAGHTRAKNWAGHVSLALLTTALVVIQGMNWLGEKPAAIVDPVPASLPLTAIGVFSLFAALAWWTGYTRSSPPARIPKRA